MILFNRNIRFEEIPGRIWVVVKVLWGSRVLKHPFTLFCDYMRMRNPRDGKVILRSGKIIDLAGHGHNLVTLFAVIVKADYGRVPRDAVVIDVGANIGTFAIYASDSAKRIIAIEPSAESYRCLVRNVELNHLDGKVTVLNRAVSSRDGDMLYIPDVSSPYNQTTKDGDVAGCSQVSTVTLGSIMHDYQVEYVDLLKMDCEGAEYDIIYNCDEGVLNKIKEIRMELHGCSVDREKMIQYLKTKGFVPGLRRDLIIWFSR